jgi:hypothetical protein
VLHQLPSVSFGTAQIYAGAARPEQLLDEAWRVGIRRFDTAPLYGGGRSEQTLGSFLLHHLGVEMVTTKVGLRHQPTGRVRRLAHRVARRALPAPAIERFRRSGRPSSSQPEVFSGRFDVSAVATSVHESLRRLGGRIDRLLLHEVWPLDITDDLHELLTRLRDSGDVGTLGVATRNHNTPACVAAGGGLFTAVNIAVGPLHEPVDLPPTVTTRAGHGLLGEAAGHLRRLQAVLDTNSEIGERWRAETVGTRFAGGDGLAHALFTRGYRLGLTEVIVATARPANVRRTFDFASDREPWPTGLSQVLSDLTFAARAPNR